MERQGIYSVLGSKFNLKTKILGLASEPGTLMSLSNSHNLQNSIDLYALAYLYFYRIIANSQF